MNTAHKYFDFIVDRESLTDWKDERLPVIHVFYVLHKDGTVEVQGNDCPAEVRRIVKDWDKLKEEILAAAKNNSEGHRWLSVRRRGRMRPEGVDPYQDIHDQWKRETGY